MFKIDRQTSLATAEWEPAELEWVEGYEYTNVRSESCGLAFTDLLKAAGKFDYHLDRGTSVRFKDWNLPSWLQREGQYASTSVPPSGKATGGFKLAFCNGKLFDSSTIGISLDDYLALEQHFCLHENTLPLFECRSGTFAKYIEYKDEEETVAAKICKLSLLIDI